MPRIGAAPGRGRRRGDGPGAEDARRRRQDRRRQAARPGAPRRTSRPSGPARSNLAKQIENVRLFGVPVVVAINAFPTDTPAEVEAIREVSFESGAHAAVVATHFVDGGAGAADLAKAVWEAAAEGAPNFRLLYPDDAPLAEKILTIATKVYGADGIDVSPTAQKALKRYEAMGFGHLPVCMAKTQYSLSHDPNLKGRPSGFTVPIRDVRLSAGAGFITPLLGEMRTMPGLPSRPGGEKIDIDADGNIVGLF